MKMNGYSGQIETLRQKLLETVDLCSGDFLHPHVLRVSQELDLLIVSVQRLQREQMKKEGTEVPIRNVIGDACLSEA